MRRKDLRGEKECRGAEALIRSRIWMREGAEKIVGSWRLVMRRVFDGGEGTISGGSEERSRVRGEDIREEGLFCSVAGGETVVFAMIRSSQRSLVRENRSGPEWMLCVWCMRRTINYCRMIIRLPDHKDLCADKREQWRCHSDFASRR